MPIRPFLPNSQSFAPEDIANMSAAFEAALGKLGLVDRSDPATIAVAKLIIAFATAGHRDPEVRLGTAAAIKVKPPQEPVRRRCVFQFGTPNVRQSWQWLQRVPGTPPSRGSRAGFSYRRVRLHVAACGYVSTESRCSQAERGACKQSIH